MASEDSAEGQAEKDVRLLLRQLNWVRGRFKVAQRQVTKKGWEYWVFSSLSHALDPTHPLMRRVYERYPDYKEKQT